jgi:hypothetical protein
MENNSLYLIKKGHVLDPASGKDGIYNIVVKNASNVILFLLILIH